MTAVTYTGILLALVATTAYNVGLIQEKRALGEIPALDIHRVLHAGSEPAVTIHAYSPPLLRLGSYEVEPSGQLRRPSVSSETELRPQTGDGHRTIDGANAAVRASFMAAW